MSHRGLAVFIRNDPNANVIVNREVDGFRHIHCQRKGYGKPVDLHAVYRPPGFDVRRFLLELEHMASAIGNGHKCVIVGDTNISTNMTLNNIANEYTRLLASYNLLVTNTNTTRPASNNVLDHVVCSDCLADSVVNDTIDTDLSDHCLTLIFSSFDMVCHASNKLLTKQIIDHSRLNELFHETMMRIPLTMTANLCKREAGVHD